MKWKRTLAFALALCLVLALSPGALAVELTDAGTAAGELHEMGLFEGTSENADGTPVFELERAPTRAEAVTMLVRLLGREDAALAGNWDTPFTDVPAWAEPYVGYAYTRGFTDGTGATTYGSGASVTASQYITFVLRALGYESGTDFEWDAAWELSDEIGLTSGEYGASTRNFTRGDVAIISLGALSCKLKCSDTNLMDTLTGELEEFAFDGVGTFYLPGDSDADTYFVDNSDVSEVYITTENVEAMAIYYSISEYEMPEDLNALYEEAIAEMGGLDMQIRFKEDAYGNSSADFTTEGVYLYMASFSTDSGFGFIIYGCPEADAANYDFGYWFSLSEIN